MRTHLLHLTSHLLWYFQVFHTMKILLLLFYKANIHLDVLIYLFFPLLSCLHAFWFWLELYFFCTRTSFSSSSEIGAWILIKLQTDYISFHWCYFLFQESLQDPTLPLLSCFFYCPLVCGISFGFSLLLMTLTLLMTRWYCKFLLFVFSYSNSCVMVFTVVLVYIS